MALDASVLTLMTVRSALNARTVAVALIASVPTLTTVKSALTPTAVSLVLSS